MSTNGNAAVVDQFVDAFNRKDATLFDAHPGLAPHKAFYQQLWAALPDLHNTVETTVAEGDWIAERHSVSGTMQGAFMGMPPTGKRATYEVIAMVRVAAGKIVEYHSQADVMGMMQQLDIGPAAAPPPH
jgi:predicted ester cyclase